MASGRAPRPGRRGRGLSVADDAPLVAQGGRQVSPRSNRCLHQVVVVDGCRLGFHRQIEIAVLGEQPAWSRNGRVVDTRSGRGRRAPEPGPRSSLVASAAGDSDSSGNLVSGIGRGASTFRFGEQRGVPHRPSGRWKRPMTSCVSKRLTDNPEANRADRPVGSTCDDRPNNPRRHGATRAQKSGPVRWEFFNSPSGFRTAMTNARARAATLPRAAASRFATFTKSHWSRNPGATARGWPRGRASVDTNAARGQRVVFGLRHQIGHEGRRDGPVRHDHDFTGPAACRCRRCRTPAVSLRSPRRRPARR